MMPANLATRLGRALIGGTAWLVLIFLAVPLIVVIAISFTTTEYLTFPPVGVTTRWYAAVLGDPTFVEAFEKRDRRARAQIARRVDQRAVEALQHAANGEHHQRQQYVSKPDDNAELVVEKVHRRVDQADPQETSID